MKLFLFISVIFICSCSTTKPQPLPPTDNGDAAAITKLQADVKSLLAQVAALKIEVSKRDTFWIEDDDIGIGSKSRPLSLQKLKKQIQVANESIADIKAALVSIRSRLTALEARLPLQTKRKKHKTI